MRRSYSKTKCFLELALILTASRFKEKKMFMVHRNFLQDLLNGYLKIAEAVKKPTAGRSQAKGLCSPKETTRRGKGR